MSQIVNRACLFYDLQKYRIYALPHGLLWIHFFCMFADVFFVQIIAIILWILTDLGNRYTGCQAG